MEKLKEFVLELDLFSHSSFHRYKEEESYRTLTGGIMSFIMVALFVGIFFNMTIDTFGTNIITADITLNYDDDPLESKLTASSSDKFMFAIGLENIDLNANQRFFDISMTTKSIVTNNSVRTKKTNLIKLEPCTVEHWTGINNDFVKSYSKLGFKEWLCPVQGQEIPLEGKYTSDLFQYAQVTVSACTQNNSDFPGTTCKTAADITSFLSSNGNFKFRFYYVNPLINPEQKQYVRYFLEDQNYFPFDMKTGILANLFFSDWTVTTDESIGPWQSMSSRTGLRTLGLAIDQNYVIDSSNAYFKFYLRKSSSNQSIQRRFQKLDETFSYIGGLFGIIILFMSILKIYSKYCYELDLGDSLFKQNKTDSFGSQGFNFGVFIGYMIYNIMAAFDIYLKWPFMEKFHKCRRECQKQLNIDFLLKKLNHFEQVSRVLLEEHHQLVLLMVPKPTLEQIRMCRKRYYLSNMMQNKNPISPEISHTDYRHQLDEYIKGEQNKSGGQNIKTLRRLKNSIVESYAKVNQQQSNHNPLNKRIRDRLDIDALGIQLCKFVFNDLQAPVSPMSPVLSNRQETELFQDDAFRKTFSIYCQNEAPIHIPVTFEDSFIPKKIPRHRIKNTKAMID